MSAQPAGDVRELSMSEALNEALRQEMERDASVFAIGEDIGMHGGLFGVTAGRSLRSVRAWRLISSTTCCSVSTIIERPNMRFRCASGTIPLRKPLSWTVPLTSCRRALNLLSISPASTMTLS